MQEEGHGPTPAQAPHCKTSGADTSFPRWKPGLCEAGSLGWQGTELGILDWKWQGPEQRGLKVPREDFPSMNDRPFRGLSYSGYHPIFLLLRLLLMALDCWWKQRGRSGRPNFL